MKLKALDVFKITPKMNCKKCGYPTCMSFSMKVEMGEVEVTACPMIDL